MSVFRKAMLLAQSSLAVWPIMASAQAPSDIRPSGASEEIIVTAQKRDERLIDVPVSISAVTSDTMVAQNLVTLGDLASRIPGLAISGGGTQNIAVRGINAGGGTNPTVSVLIDDVQFGSSSYLGQPPIPSLDPAIIQQIEVLRGPQGTLYGASSLGGLIKYVTRSPSTSKFSGEAQVGINSVDHGGEGWSARSAINVPIILDRVALSVSGFYRRDPQYIDSVVAGVRTKDANMNRVWGGRAAVQLNPIDALEITLSVLAQRTESEGSEDILVCPSCRATVGANTVVTFDPRGVSTDEFTSNVAVVPRKAKLNLYTGRAKLDLGFADLTSVTAWGQSDQQTTSDVSNTFGGALNGFYGAGGTYLLGAPIKTNKFSQELRLEGTGSLVDWLIGGFYTVEHSRLAQTIMRSGLNNVIYSSANVTSYRENAVFGDVTLHATEKLDVQLGARYAHNKQNYNVVGIVDVPAQPVFGVGENAVFRSNENALTWLVTPTYRFNPDMMAYARIASGYRPGGPNTASPGASPSFDKDTVISYELGFKGSTLDRRATFDIAVFRIDWKDIQLQNTALPSQFLFIQNGKTARSSGLEFAFTAQGWTGLTITANGSIQNAKLTKSLDRTEGGTQRLFGLADDLLPNAAKFTTNIGATQQLPLNDSVDVDFGFNVNHVSSRYANFNQDLAAGPAGITRPRLPAYTLVDLFGNVKIGEMWELGLYVRNLLNEISPLTVDTRSGTRLPTATFTRPRTIGANLQVKF
ncbi:Outer membrane receptor proteins, mostly Fe transport [Sphingobium sp. AP50]|uniref:TonB-dependent receptor n=1 Tax=Sphingobium sp. AP50 TaxID=1884369 RepID=UPI0008BA56A6|nr:TonB-dependent receptor [Sphingobium sp. AP50]SEJ98409.1 Outer membrane receptor proteins, mostly Fe transport [Sphingobium sp. AP50]